MEITYRCTLRALTSQPNYVEFSIAVVNQIHDKDTVKYDTQRQFTAQSAGWGFRSFLLLSELHDPDRGYLVNDTCVVEVEVSVSNMMETSIQALSGKSTDPELLPVKDPVTVSQPDPEKQTKLDAQAESDGDTVENHLEEIPPSWRFT